MDDLFQRALDLDLKVLNLLYFGSNFDIWIWSGDIGLSGTYSAFRFKMVGYGVSTSPESYAPCSTLRVKTINKKESCGR